MDPGKKLEKPSTEKDFRTKHLIKEALMENDFLKNLSSSQVRDIIDHMTSKKIAAGAYVIREGETSLFINKRFALNEMFQRNASKFAIFYV